MTDRGEGRESTKKITPSAGRGEADEAIEAIRD